MKLSRARLVRGEKIKRGAAPGGAAAADLAKQHGFLDGHGRVGEAFAI